MRETAWCGSPTRADRDSGSAGLGLPVALGLARAHQGDLTCHPPEHGAVFRLTLPIIIPDQPHPNAATSLGTVLRRD